jgi:hypothetical protein
MVEDSLERWQVALADSGGRYSYTRSSYSFVGSSCETTVHVLDGTITARAQLTTLVDRDNGTRSDTYWSESQAEIGSQTSACHPPRTMEQLYEECLVQTLCEDPRENYIDVTFDEQGLLLRCTYFPMGCADDCGRGVDVSELRLGDDAPDCCEPDSAPDCCMAYGGPDLTGSCEVLCDGMPVPSAPWKRELDDSGCAHWVEPDLGPFCGAFP